MNDENITKEMIDSNSSWFSVLLLLLLFANFRKGDEEQCTEATTDITTQQEIQVFNNNL